MKAHILLVADGRSPTALSWLGHLQALGYTISFISTFPCTAPEGVQHFQVLPVALSRFSNSGSAGSKGQPPAARTGVKRALVRRLTPLLQQLRYTFGPCTLRRYIKPYQNLVQQIQPDLVHALRIPFEGMLAAHTPPDIPFIAATWGNDLTLHAQGSPAMRRQTQRCLARADGLTSDTQRDVRLAREWGLSPDAPALVIPGSGGLDTVRVQNAMGFDPAAFGIPEGVPWVVNPRGMRPGSVHQEVFFAAIPKILARRPEARFLCPSLAGVPQAAAWVRQYDIEAATFLLPKLTQEDLWSLFRQAQVFASPSSHDGTPNTLLEAMACGCFPVAGQIESLAEWITPGENGFLVDPRDPDALADAILQALADRPLRETAAARNRQIIQDKADQHATRPRIETFYDQFLH